MKQLIIIILLLGGGYYLYNNGFLKIFKDMKLSPKELVSDVKTAAAQSAAAPAPKALPQKAAGRACGATISKASFNALEKAVFAAYDSRAAYALAELAYGAGLEEADGIITRYLSIFTLPEEKNRLLALASKYQDKDSLALLYKFYVRGTFPRKTVLRKIADYKAPEAAELILAAAEDGNAAVRAEAQAMLRELEKEPWFINAGQKKLTLPAQHTKELFDIPLAQQ